MTYHKKINKHLLHQLVVGTVTMLTLVSCYHITFIKQNHRVVKGSALVGKMVVKATGGSTNGKISDVTGLFGIRLPEGWEVETDIVMTQVPKPTTDVGDDSYKKTIHRKMVANEKYTALLNKDYPKKDYSWIGFATESDFKTLVNNADPTKDIDSIYVIYTIYPSEDTTGVYYLDYVGGHITAGHEDEIGTYDRDWNTRCATFEGDNIAHVYNMDTHVTVVNPDGSYDATNDEFAKPVEWELEALPNNTLMESVKAYKDKKYDKLFTRTRGWNGGDGVLTVGLPNGDVFWTFNDSFYGVVDSASRSRGSCSFPRNSIMVQRAHDGVPGTNPEDFVWLADYVNWTDPSSDKYFHARTHLRHPLGEKTEEQIADGEIDQGMVYWSGDGTIYNGKLQMIWIGTESAKLKNIGTALATYNIDGTMPKGYYLDDIPDYLPKPSDYLGLEDVTHDVNSNMVSYGSTIWEDEDGHNYLYAANGTDAVVARTATHDLYSKWQYYVKNDDGTWTWQDNYPDPTTMKRSNIMAKSDYAIMLPWVFKKDGWYFLMSQAPIFSTSVYLYRSKNPWGPFDERKLLLRLPDHLDKLGNTAYHWLYMVNLHPALAREGELVLSTNSDANDFWDNFNAKGSADFYRPFFYRVFDWEKLYPDLATGIKGITEKKEKPYQIDVYYNLQGMRVKHPRHGIYIHNGKKVLVK
ncbi:MAG: DUF5005 domain-containing protein [Prevotella sp.]|jgi:hypothetical protein